MKMVGNDLIVVDQLYGAITIPAWLKPVVFSPELQRLREVRLINTTSPTCGSLSDARRFTHTLGVLHLASKIAPEISNTWSRDESKAFLVAALLHDIGTPAFGHLFEYQLAAIKGWDHERFVLDIIKGTYNKSKKYHQIYYKNPLKLSGILQDIKVDVELVANLVTGKNTLGQLLAGIIDLDNIDNVFRMAILLDLSSEKQKPMELVARIHPEKSGLVFDEDIIPLLDTWRSLRRKAYEILAFDESCLSGQAMLTDCFTTTLISGRIDENYWYFTDEQILREFIEIDEIKEIVQRFAIGDYYSQIYLGWYNNPKGDADLRHPEIRAKFIQDVRDNLHIDCSPYIFYDSGTFSKKLSLNIRKPDGQKENVDIGERSQSTIVSIFTPTRVSDSNKKKYSMFFADFLEGYGLKKHDLMSIPKKENVYRISGQQEILF